MKYELNFENAEAMQWKDDTNFTKATRFCNSEFKNSNDKDVVNIEIRDKYFEKFKTQSKKTLELGYETKRKIVTFGSRLDGSLKVLSQRVKDGAAGSPSKRRVWAVDDNYWVVKGENGFIMTFNGENFDRYFNITAK